MIAKKILYWYDNNKRSLPWRKKLSQVKREYYTLVSEFMLQQTQVATVIPYFNNFIKDIPDIKSLSNIIDENIKLGIDDGEIIAQKFQEKNKHLNFIYGLGIDTINTFFNIDSKLKNNLSEPIFKILEGNKFLNKYATFLSN